MRSAKRSSRTARSSSRAVSARGPETILERHPKVLKVTGPHAYEEVVGAVHEHLPPKHDPFLDLVPPQGIRLTPRHYAYLKISEGCNNKCSFCIIPSMRGLLVSRPIDEVLREGEKLARAGVKELLVISQDTSAYGVDIRYRAAEWRGQQYETRFLDLARGLGELGIWVRMHYVYPYPHVDDVIPLMAERKILPYLDIPFQHGSPTVLKRMKRPGQVEKTLSRIKAWREVCPDLTIRSTFIVGFPGRDGSGVRRVAGVARRGAARSRRRVQVFAGGRRGRERRGAARGAGDPGRAARAVHAEVGGHQRGEARGESRASAWKCWSMAIDGNIAIARSMADAPEIDGVVKIVKGGKLQAGRVRRRRDHGVERSRSRGDSLPLRTASLPIGLVPTA